MAQPILDTDTLKQLLKEALAETLDEKRELLREVVAEALEDIALTEAIREGKQSERIARKEVFDLLGGMA